MRVPADDCFRGPPPLVSAQARHEPHGRSFTYVRDHADGSGGRADSSVRVRHGELGEGATQPDFKTNADVCAGLLSQVQCAVELGGQVAYLEHAPVVLALARFRRAWFRQLCAARTKLEGQFDDVLQVLQTFDRLLQAKKVFIAHLRSLEPQPDTGPSWMNS
jgi:hypothetical protein